MQNHGNQEIGVYLRRAKQAATTNKRAMQALETQHNQETIKWEMDQEKLNGKFKELEKQKKTEEQIRVVKIRLITMFELDSDHSQDITDAKIGHVSPHLGPKPLGPPSPCPVSSRHGLQSRSGLHPGLRA